MPSIKRELKAYDLTLRKKLGQHFLVDRNILEKIIRIAGVQKEDVVLEIGPGLGEMTLGLSKRARQVFAVEIDSRLIRILKEKLTALPNVILLQKDILKIDPPTLFDQAGVPLKVVANLPYHISTPLLFYFIEARKYFSDFTIMLQREVAERLTAQPGTKEYGALSVLIQMVFIPKVHSIVKPSAFFPPPKVESAIITLSWRKDPLLDVEEEHWVKEVVKASFRHRRKTLINSLNFSGLPLPSILERRMEGAGIDPKRRPETLSVEEFVRLARALKSSEDHPSFPRSHPA